MIRWTRAKDAHEAVFSSAVTYYTYAFSLNSGLHVDAVAERLLSTNLAETAIIPWTDEIKVASRYSEVYGARQDALGLVRLRDLGKTTSGSPGVWRWMTQHPRLAAKLVGPLTSFYVMRVFGLKDRSSVDEVGQDAMPDMAETIRVIDESVRDQQVLIGAIAAVDRDFYDPGYLADAPFLRLELRSLNFTLQEQVFPTVAGYTEEAIVTLMIHRSGVALLNFAVPLPRSVQSSNLSDLTVGGANVFSSFRLCKEVLDLGSKQDGKSGADIAGEWEHELSRGTYWKTCTWENGMSIQDLYVLYSRAISQAIKVTRSDESFLCYNSLFLDQISCCGNKSKWVRRHRSELAGLAGRFGSFETASDGVLNDLIGKDWSLTRQASTHLNPGNAVRIVWDFSSDRKKVIADHFWTLAVIESFLLQLWQLRQLSHGLSLGEGARPLVRAQERIMLGLSEFRESHISYASAQEMVAHLTHLHGLDRLYQQALDRLAALQTFVESRRNLAADRRDALLTGLGTVAAVIFGLPAIDQSIHIIQSLPSSAAGPTVRFSGDEHLLAWRVYLALVGIICLGLASSLIRRTFRWAFKPRLHRKIRDFGMTWPLGSLKVSLGNGRRHGLSSRKAADTPVRDHA